MWWEPIKQYMNDHLSSIEHVGWNALKIAVLIIVARIGIKLLTRIADQAVNFHDKMEERRKNTLHSLLSNFIKYTIYFILILTILPIFGIQIGALLAGAGVAGIAIAFSAQSLLKDFFNGFFILLEDQFGVGDSVVINGIGGTVKSVGLRVTSIQIWTGQVEIIPNGEIKQVTNYSKENSLAVVDVNIGYNTAMEQSIAIIRQVMEQLKQTEADIIGNTSVLGVQELNDSTYTIRATAECKSGAHGGIQRLAKQRIHTAFVREGIDLPLRKIVYLHDHQAGK